MRRSNSLGNIVIAVAAYDIRDNKDGVSLKEKILDDLALRADEHSKEVEKYTFLTLMIHLAAFIPAVLFLMFNKGTVHYELIILISMFMGIEAFNELYENALEMNRISIKRMRWYKKIFLAMELCILAMAEYYCVSAMPYLISSFVIIALKSFTLGHIAYDEGMYESFMMAARFMEEHPLPETEFNKLFAASRYFAVEVIIAEKEKWADVLNGVEDDINEESA